MKKLFTPASSRYSNMIYRRTGASGLLLPALSLGLWHNFGDVDDKKIYKKLLFDAFDAGITHFDLANNYGPPPGSAETNFGKILHNDFKNYRDELIISTKAGYTMWDGPYGDWGSRKYLIASLHQSLKRMKLDYVDIFYSHRYDPETPIEETMGALDWAVKQGKALYAGVSNYPPDKTREAYEILKAMGTPCLIHQPKYSMLERTPEAGLLQTLKELGIGCIVFSPLAQGLLTDKYFKGIPKTSRAGAAHGHLQENQVTEELVEKVKKMNVLAAARSQTMAQLAVAWLLRDPVITSVLIGARNSAQLNDNLGALKNINFSESELKEIDAILKS